MYIIGQEEVDAIARVIRSGALFRYGDQSECARFENRYANYLSVDNFSLSASGSYALAAGMIGLGIGPGDEVLVPSHTYMATATSVLAAGAIPVPVEIDDSLTIDVAAAREAVGPRTRAIVPVHMWGAACDMDGVLALAKDRGLFVIEDACQGIGGAYEGHKFGTLGDVGAFSFNYYKNITSGEGGGVTAKNPDVVARAKCAIDPCGFYWNGKEEGVMPFAGIGARASELMGAILNVQLDRLDGMIEAMRKEKKRILAGTAHLHNLGLRASPMHSPDHDCATQVMLQLPSADAARRFSEIFPSVIASRTGRHNYTLWDPVLTKQGAAHPALNPYKLPQNQACRLDVSKGDFPRSLDILDRTVMIATDPLRPEGETDDIIHDIDLAARVVAGEPSARKASLRSRVAIDARKFDMAEE